jgi:hypothetical protein
MPSRVAAVAKIVVCVTTSSGPRPGTSVSSSRPVVTEPQTRQLHVPTQTTLLSTPKSVAAVSLSSLHLSHRHQQHHQHHSTKMDAALAKLFVSNSQWVKAVNSAEPGFFEQSAKKQTPKVRTITTILPFALYFMLMASFRVLHTDRSSGSDARTLVSQKVS